MVLCVERVRKALLSFQYEGDVVVSHVSRVNSLFVLRESHKHAQCDVLHVCFPLPDGCVYSKQICQHTHPMLHTHGCGSERSNDAGEGVAINSAALSQDDRAQKHKVKRQPSACQPLAHSLLKPLTPSMSVMMAREAGDRK